MTELFPFPLCVLLVEQQGPFTGQAHAGVVRTAMLRPVLVQAVLMDSLRHDHLGLPMLPPLKDLQYPVHEYMWLGDKGIMRLALTPTGPGEGTSLT